MMFNNGDEYWGDYTPQHRSKNFNAPPGVHIMNKNEKKELRKLKSETGLTEDELRKEKKYRKKLSEAQKKEGTKDRYERLLLSFVKTLTKETKLPVTHPEFKIKLNEKLKEQNRWYSRSASLLCLNTPDQIISHYLSLRKKQKNKK